MHREERRTGQIAFSEKDFKVCDLCGALNRIANNQCFICGWNGMFHQEEVLVRRAMKEFEVHYGGINNTVLSEELLPDEPTGPGLFATLIEKIRCFFSVRDTA